VLRIGFSANRAPIHKRIGKSLWTGWKNSVLLLPFALLFTVSANAQTPRLGVVKAPENAGQWEGISARLQATGVNYCVVDLPQWSRAADLGGTKLLFLPNVEILNSQQIVALQEWMEKGGRVIASGPTGSLSQPDVRTRLRSLLGAYWGFALTAPSSLEPLRVNTQPWVRQDGLAGNVSGGVVIPAGLNSSTVAVWKSSDTPPAVVTTDKSVFLGWRWGVDAVSTTALDSAWLTAALGRYGETPTAGGSVSTDSQQSCSSGGTTANRSPKSGTTTAQVGTDDVVSPPATVLPRAGERLSAAQVTAMRQELENLIGRFESALLASEATSSNITLQAAASAAQSGDASPKGAIAQTVSNRTPPLSSAQRSLVAARAGLQNFLQLVEQKNYNQARQEWLQVRRILWEGYPTDRPQASSEVRAMWLDRGTIVRAGSEKNLAKVLDSLAAAGINTVFLETVNAGYPIYPSQVAPEQNPQIQGWDPLKSAIKLAHERGMELHAWVWIFAAGNQRHNLLLNQPASYPGPVLSKHPDWAGYDNRGQTIPLTQTKPFFDPANPEVRRYLIALLEEIATNYEVDGIQLDYIRYPFQDESANQTYGYGMAARQQFQALTGVDPAKISPRDRQLWKKWTDFRLQQIDSFVATASQRLRAKRPSLIISAAVFPIPRRERLQRLQQNWEDWVNRGDVDLVIPMTYALETNQLQNLAQPWLMQSSLSSALVLPGIRLLNLPDIVAVDQIQLLRDSAAVGYSLFAAENLNTNLHSIFSRTQGRNDKTPNQPLPHRQPFAAASVRYGALQREWSYLLSTNQLRVEQDSLTAWSRQADAVNAALNQLATEPSSQNLSVAKTKVAAFRRQFSRWMQLQTAEQPYQVQVWNNRLATIEQLLSYGERVQLRGSN
jgi:uncharacterized lipoprotein YddW (UPF0748 family)